MINNELILELIVFDESIGFQILVTVQKLVKCTILVKITDILISGRKFELCRNFWGLKTFQVRSDRVKEHFLFLLFYDISQIEKNRRPATPPQNRLYGGGRHTNGR